MSYSDIFGAVLCGFLTLLVSGYVIFGLYVIYTEFGFKGIVKMLVTILLVFTVSFFVGKFILSLK